MGGSWPQDGSYEGTLAIGGHGGVALTGLRLKGLREAAGQEGYTQNSVGRLSTVSDREAKQELMNWRRGKNGDS